MTLAAITTPILVSTVENCLRMNGRNSIGKKTGLMVIAIPMIRPARILRRSVRAIKNSTNARKSEPLTFVKSRVLVTGSVR